MTEEWKGSKTRDESRQHRYRWAVIGVLLTAFWAVNLPRAIMILLPESGDGIAMGIALWILYTAPVALCVGPTLIWNACSRSERRVGAGTVLVLVTMTYIVGYAVYLAIGVIANLLPK